MRGKNSCSGGSNNLTVTGNLDVQTEILNTQSTIIVVDDAFVAVNDANNSIFIPIPPGTDLGITSIAIPKYVQRESYYKGARLKFNNKEENFELVEGSFYNKDKYLNDISINKSKNKIFLNSNNFDLSSYIEKSLKSRKKSNFFDIFKNLNTSININIKNAKIDDEHNLKNLKGVTLVENNKFNKANILGNFNSVDNFTYTIQKLDGKKVTTIYSDVAKPFVKKFKFIKGFEDGKIDYTSTEIKKNLLFQLTAPVKWTQSVQNMLKDGATEFIEVGPGKVLQGLVKKVDRQADTSSASV